MIQYVNFNQELGKEKIPGRYIVIRESLITKVKPENEILKWVLFRKAEKWERRHTMQEAEPEWEADKISHKSKTMRKAEIQGVQQREKVGYIK